MTTTSGINPLAGTSGSLTATGTGATATTQSAATQATNFLTMLVAQMQNQDPLNPMDSAQVTSQMAQISTVQGVQQLNTTMASLGSQIGQLQTLQGVALVGKDVATSGDAVRVNSTTGVGDGGFQLSSPASSVKVTVLDPSGNTVDTLNLGALDSGRQSFNFNVPQADQGQALTFKVDALNGQNAVTATPLSYSTVDAVTSQGGSLSLELANGQAVGYDAIQAFL